MPVFDNINNKKFKEKFILQLSENTIIKQFIVTGKD